jgi:hypothetical protein
MSRRLENGGVIDSDVFFVAGTGLASGGVALPVFADLEA